MASLAMVKVLVEVIDATGPVIERDLLPVRFAPGAGKSGLMETVTLTGSSFTAIAVPAGAKAALFEFDTTDVNMVLKGVTGDTGITISPATNPVGCPMLLPLGASPSLGILNNGPTVTVNVTFL